MEIDLLKNYPKPKRNLTERSLKTEEDVRIARKFGPNFFDGDRKHGYGGYRYDEKFFAPCIPDFIKQYELTRDSKILDIGCAKGFMLFDFMKAIPGVTLRGIDISEYAIENAMTAVRHCLRVGNAKKLPYKCFEFDLGISINTIHNLPLEDCKKAIKEIERVCMASFIVVDAYENEDEKKRMMDWNLTAKTIMSRSQWRRLFKECEYTGDFYWFTP